MKSAVTPQHFVATEELCQSRGQLPGLPTIHFAGQVIIGYQGDHITGAQFEDLIRRVSGAEDPKRNQTRRRHRRQAHIKVKVPTIRLVGFWSRRTLESPSSSRNHEFTTFPWRIRRSRLFPMKLAETDIGEAASTPEPSPSEPQSDIIDLPVFGQLRVSDLGLPLFTFLVGLVDGFNPCAMWILVFLLSVLVNIKDRRKILLIAGTFVLVSGIAYFAFMAAWLNLFMLIGIARTGANDTWRDGDVDWYHQCEGLFCLQERSFPIDSRIEQTRTL